MLGLTIILWPLLKKNQKKITKKQRRKYTKNLEIPRLKNISRLNDTKHSARDKNSVNIQPLNLESRSNESLSSSDSDIDLKVRKLKNKRKRSLGTVEPLKRSSRQ